MLHEVNPAAQRLGADAYKRYTEAKGFNDEAGEALATHHKQHAHYDWATIRKLFAV